ncbi:MAG: hypothetical protein ACOYM3_34820, partial [Terrimicrobiaceae bacterium]
MPWNRNRKLRVTPIYGSKLDDILEHWNTLKQSCNFSGILVGNGASRAVWNGFEYSSLYNN